MAHEVPWCKIILEEFIAEAALTEEEEEIIRTRVAGWSRTKQADKLGMSLSTVDRIIKRLKVKYDNVQKFSPILPPRRSFSEEVYMDTH